jgi:hypothetical protein
VAEAVDIVQMLSLLTVNKIVLPCFVTVNLERMPPMTWRCCPAVSELPVGDAATMVGVLSADMSNLSTVMNAVLQRLDAVETKLVAPVPPVQLTAAVSTGNSHSSSTVAPTDKLPTPPTSVSWASRVVSAVCLWCKSCCKTGDTYSSRQPFIWYNQSDTKTFNVFRWTSGCQHN